MTMFYTPWGGEQVVIPAEHEKVLALYRDSMPLVFEVQEYGPPMLYALVDEDADPVGVRPAGSLERVALSVGRQIQGKRRDDARPKPSLDRLIREAVAEYLREEYIDAVENRRDGPVSAVETWAAAEEDVNKAARRVGRWVKELARDAVEGARAEYALIEQQDPTVREGVSA